MSVHNGAEHLPARKHSLLYSQKAPCVRRVNPCYLFLSEKKQLEEERERLQRRIQELEELISGEKEILLKKNIPVEQMMEYLGYEKLTREMLEEYVQGIYLYDDGRVEVEWKE